MGLDASEFTVSNGFCNMSILATPPELPAPEPTAIVRYQSSDLAPALVPEGREKNSAGERAIAMEAKALAETGSEASPQRELIPGYAPTRPAPTAPETTAAGDSSWETRAELLGPPMEVSWPQRPVAEELRQELAVEARKNKENEDNPEGLSQVNQQRSPNAGSDSLSVPAGKVESKQLEESRGREDAAARGEVDSQTATPSETAAKNRAEHRETAPAAEGNARNPGVTRAEDLEQEAIAPLEKTIEEKTQSAGDSVAQTREAVAIPRIRPIYNYLGKSLIPTEARGESEGESREAVAIPRIRPIYDYLGNKLKKSINVAIPETIPEAMPEAMPEAITEAMPEAITETIPETIERQGNRETEITESPSPDANGVPVKKADVVEVRADSQEYDDREQTVTAAGDVLLRVRGALLNAKWVQVNLLSRIAVAEGNVALNNGEQFLQGDRLEYDIARDRGGMEQGKGQIFLTSASRGLQPTLPTDVAALSGENRPLSKRLRAGEPPQNVTSTGGISVGVGAGRGASLQGSAPGSGINRLRFESEQLNFTANGWEASNVRITNDPFSPPELELRADRATMRRLSPQQDEIIAKRPRLVFDGRFSIPLLRERAILDRSERDPSLIRFGYDGGDRGGLYAESTVDFPVPAPVRFVLIPQFFMQKAIQRNGANFRQLFGLKAKLRGNLTPTTSIDGSAVFTTLDFGEANDKLRGSLRLRQQVGRYAVAGEYSYRDRLFNGSLGFQTVRQNLGLVVSSPVIPLAKTGFNLSYQGSAQHIKADTDRLDLLEPIRENNLANLNRFQASAALSRGLLLWKGKPLASTRAKGLRYTPTPVLPYIRMFGGLTGVASAYSNGENQNSLAATIGIQGQFGHFSRKWLDYTGFNVGFSRIWKNGESPFVFDRVPDAKVLSAGISQQVYGPFKLGLQTAINLDTREAISTDYILEYSRRTYGITLRYNPQRELGSLTLRLSDFNWVGGSESFSGTDVRSVDGGVSR